MSFLETEFIGPARQFGEWGFFRFELSVFEENYLPANCCNFGEGYEA